MYVVGKLLFINGTVRVQDVDGSLRLCLAAVFDEAFAVDGHENVVLEGKS
jgi:hypothetical protein